MNYNPVNKLESYYGIIRRILAEGKEKKNKKWPTNQKTLFDSFGRWVN
jgi:hypothetical protein